MKQYITKKKEILTEDDLANMHNNNAPLSSFILGSRKIKEDVVEICKLHNITNFTIDYEQDSFTYYYLEFTNDSRKYRFLFSEYKCFFTITESFKVLDKEILTQKIFEVSKSFEKKGYTLIDSSLYNKPIIDHGKFAKAPEYFKGKRFGEVLFGYE